MQTNCFHTPTYIDYLETATKLLKKNTLEKDNKINFSSHAVHNVVISKNQYKVEGQIDWFNDSRRLYELYTVFLKEHLLG